jgi:hypothetical protein
MKPDEFEQKLSRQPLRPVPAAWREDILSAAREARPSVQASRVTHHSWLATFNHQLSTLFWPHPIAWAGLAAVWICLGALNISMRDPATGVAEKSAPPSPEMVAELKKQQRMFAELVGSYEPAEADRPKNLAPRPRGARTEFMAT